MAEMMLGSRGQDVRGWQSLLRERGFVGKDGKQLSVDGDFGANTEWATQTFQGRYGLAATGVVDAATFNVASGLPPLAAATFRQARNFKPLTGAMRKIDLVVIHTMESPEKGDTAESCANWFATQPVNGTIDPKTGRKFGGTSAHYAIDSDSVVQCVREKDVAWAAPGANHNGVHLEHAGYARQTAAEWADDYSQRMLKRSAELAAEVCGRFVIPAWRVDAAGLRANARGITTHADVTLAFKLGSHTDPGPAFPMDQYLGWVLDALSRGDAQ